MASCSQPMACCHQMGRGQGHVVPSNFDKTVVISRKRHKITWLQRETITKSYTLEWPLTPKYQMSSRLRFMLNAWLCVRYKFSYYYYYYYYYYCYNLFWYIRLPFVSLVRVKLTTSKSMYLLNTANTSQPMTCCSQVRRGQGHVITSNFGKKWQYLKRLQVSTWLQWVTIEWSHFVFHVWSIKWWHCWWPLMTLSHISETTKPISFKLSEILDIWE